MFTLQSRPCGYTERSLAAAAILFSLIAGCGGGASSGSGSNPTPTPTPAATTVVQVNVGDSPADWMLAFSMNITAMSLTGSGASQTVVSASTPMEMMHLMGSMQPLAMMAISQGTYTGATVTVGSATVTYMDPSTRQVVQQTISGPMTANVTFNAPVTVGATPMAMGFDLDLANSVTANSGGTMTMNPVFHVSSGSPGSANPMNFTDGGIQQMMGSVTTLSGSSFTMSSMQAAQSFTFATNSSTTYATGSMGAMSTGMLVMVDAQLQADGTLLATRVQSMMSSGGMMGGGIVTAVTGQPATALTLVMQNGVGNGMMGSYFAQGFTVNVSSGAIFSVNDDLVDLSGLPFTPAFDSTHIYAGQSVMPVSTGGMMSGGGGMGGMGGGMMAGSIGASGLYLTPQALTGTAGASIAGSTTSTFTLTLPSDSAFTTLTGATRVTVYQQASTYVSSTSAIASGTSVHTLGLLFFDGRQWKMVAERIAAS